jgi:group I intron endonuclease
MLVYLITNTVNGKRYIGQTSYSLEKRWFLHCNRKSCTALHNAINKYGADKFTAEILFSVPTKELAGELEIEYIKRYNTKAPNGYNLTDGGEGVKSLSDEIRIKRNQKLLGNRNAVGAIRTPEYLKALSERFKGRVFSEETKHKMSEAAKAKVVSQETKAKLSAERKLRGVRPPKLTSEQAAEAGRISGHKRYHVARGINNPECKLCQEGQSNASNPQSQS